MGTFDPGQILQRYLPHTTSDEVLDNLIRDVLIEDGRARPSAGAWERLRQVILERHHKYGMWVLDEPLRDPPESLPMILNAHQYERAMRIYHMRCGREYRYETMLYKSVWGGTTPSFSALLNW